MSSSVPVKSEIDDEYSNSSESSGPVDLSEGALRVFTEHPETRKEDKPPNQIIEVLVEGKIQLIEIQPVAEVCSCQRLVIVNCFFVTSPKASPQLICYLSGIANTYLF